MVGGVGGGINHIGQLGTNPSCEQQDVRSNKSFGSIDRVASHVLTLLDYHIVISSPVSSFFSLISKVSTSSLRRFRSAAI